MSEQLPPENSSSGPESVAEIIALFKTKPYVSICKYIDGKSQISKTLQRRIGTSEKSPRFYEKVIKLSSQMDVALLEVRLPASGKIAELVSEQKPGLLQDLNYVRLVYQSKKELEENLEFAGLIRLRSYYALILARIALAKPELIGETEMTVLCEKFQNLDEKIDRQELNNLIFNYLQRAQVNASDIKFDPKFAPEIKVQWFQDHFGFHEESAY